ncbi:MAG TPA: hypothetical protein VL424_20205 [Pararobbsia sp.]|nr:hypothetical protein [Pararobbsia sp.]
MNFFDANCQQGPIVDTTFGICDDEKGGVAYVELNTPTAWVATVLNPNARAVTFTAIDKCVIKDGEERDRGRCDGMLTTDQHLYLVELKNQRHAWKSHATDQLKSTIRFLQDSSDQLDGYRYRKAFACNRRHPSFNTVSNEEQKAFFREFGFRLDIQATIKID